MKVNTSEEEKKENAYAEGEYNQEKKGRDRANSDEAVEIVTQPSLHRSKLNTQRKKEAEQRVLNNLKIPSQERDEILDDSRLFERSKQATTEQSEDCEEVNISLDNDLYKPNKI